MALSWRKARLDDAALLWRWANDAETRRNAFDPAPHHPLAQVRGERLNLRQLGHPATVPFPGEGRRRAQSLPPGAAVR